MFKYEPTLSEKQVHFITYLWYFSIYTREDLSTNQGVTSKTMVYSKQDLLYAK